MRKSRRLDKSTDRRYDANFCLKSAKKQVDQQQMGGGQGFAKTCFLWRPDRQLTPEAMGEAAGQALQHPLLFKPSEATVASPRSSGTMDEDTDSTCKIATRDPRQNLLHRMTTSRPCTPSLSEPEKNVAQVPDSPCESFEGGDKSQDDADSHPWGRVPRRRRSSAAIHHILVSQDFHIMNIVEPTFKLDLQQHRPQPRQTSWIDFETDSEAEEEAPLGSHAQRLHASPTPELSPSPLKLEHSKAQSSLLDVLQPGHSPNSAGSMDTFCEPHSRNMTAPKHSISGERRQSLDTSVQTEEEKGESLGRSRATEAEEQILEGKNEKEEMAANKQHLAVFTPVQVLSDTRKRTCPTHSRRYKKKKREHKAATAERDIMSRRTFVVLDASYFGCASKVEKGRMNLCGRKVKALPVKANPYFT